MELLLPERRPLAPPDLLDLYDAPGPHLRGGMLVSADGASSYAGGSRPLQTPGDSAVFAALRAVSDAVLVGAGTARTERYGPVRLSERSRAWRAARSRADSVPLVVVSRSLDLPADAPSLHAGGALVVTCAAAPTHRREKVGAYAEVLVCGQEQVDLRAARDRLAERGLVRVLCEGGPALLGDLVRADLLTELCATVAPVLAGDAAGLVGGALPAPVPLVLVHLLREGSTLMGRWRVAR